MDDLTENEAEDPIGRLAVKGTEEETNALSQAILFCRTSNLDLG